MTEKARIHFYSSRKLSYSQLTLVTLKQTDTKCLLYATAAWGSEPGASMLSVLRKISNKGGKNLPLANEKGSKK